MTALSVGTFVPFRPPRCGTRSALVGWIVAANGCHLWQGYCDPQGYGSVRVGGRMQLVHRVRYEREVGPIPAGMELDHFACNTPSCCNPAHVRPVTPRENMLRGDTLAAAWAARTHCAQGHPFAGANLRVTPRDGRRRCRTCDRLRQREFRALRASAVVPPPRS